MQQYKVLCVDSEIHTDEIKTPLYDANTGQVVSYKSKTVEYQIAHATDGTRYGDARMGNPVTEYVFRTCPGAIDPGDIVEAWDDRGQLRDINVVRGRNAIAQPAPPEPAAPMQPLPETSTEQTPAWLGSVMNGCSMSGEDLKQFAAFCLNLAQKHKNLAAAFRQHLSECNYKGAKS